MLGIDISKNSIKIAALKHCLGGNWKLVGLVQRSLSHLDSEEVDATIISAVKEAMNNSGNSVGYIGITGSVINLQTIPFPVAKPSYLCKAINFEIQQRIDSTDSSYFDYYLTNTKNNHLNNTIGIICFARKDYIDALFQKLPLLKIKGIIPTPFAIYNSWQNGKQSGSETIMILDIGADNTDTLIIKEHNLIFAKNISTGSKIFDENIRKMVGTSYEECELTKIEKANLIPNADDSNTLNIYPAIRTASATYVNMIQSLILSAKNQLKDCKINIDKILISGGGAKLRGFREYLENSLKLPVEYFNPLKNIDIYHSNSESLNNFKELPTIFAAAIGLAQTSRKEVKSKVPNILPPSIKKRQIFLTHTIFLYLGAAILTVTMLLLTIINLAAKNTAQDEINNFLEQVKEIENKSATFSDLKKKQKILLEKIKNLSNETSTGYFIIDIINKLLPISPQGLFLTEIKKQEIENNPVLIFNGMIDESNIKGDVKEILKDIEKKLNNPSEEIYVKITDVKKSTKAGWLEFSIHVEFNSLGEKDEGLLDRK